MSEGGAGTPRLDVVQPDDAGWGLPAPDPIERTSLWPNRQQELLITAGTARGEPALAAWEEWKAGARIDAIDRASQQLLHLAYRNLTSQGVRDPFLASIKPSYRVTWARNQQLFHALWETLQQFHAAGIETLVFKGAAMTQLYYKDHGVRPMDDVDVLVPESKFGAAVDVLMAHRWMPFYHDPKFFDVRFEHAIGFTNRLGESIDLHCHVLMASCEQGADAAFWEGSVRLDVDGVATRSLCATDHLLHACTHGVLWAPRPPLRWITDALTLMGVAGPEIDWTRLVSTARARGVTRHVALGLEYLRATFNAPVPADPLRDLEASVTRADERRYRIWSRNRRGKPIRLLHHHWAMFRRGIGPVGPVRALLMVPQYLRFWAQTGSLVTTPLRLAGKAVRVLGRRLGLYRYWDGS